VHVVLVTVSAMKRTDVPKRRRDPDALRPPFYLALCHGNLARRPTWRLRVVPANYRLRYICQRGPSVRPSVTVCHIMPLFYQNRELRNISYIL